MLPRTWNLGNLLLVFGMLVLGGGTWLMYRGAARVARIEERASLHAERWAEVLRRRPAVDFAQEGTPRDLLLLFRNLPGHAAPGRPRLEVIATPDHLRGQAACFQTDHYYYMLARVQEGHPYATKLAAARDQRNVGQPAADPIEKARWRWPWGAQGPAGMPAEGALLEVYAWPRTSLSPGKTVFFAPASGTATFHRNLDSNYFGLRASQVPMPGSARSSLSTGGRRGMLKNYRGYDDLLWLLPRSDAITD